MFFWWLMRTIPCSLTFCYSLLLCYYFCTAPGSHDLSIKIPRTYQTTTRPQIIKFTNCIGGHVMSVISVRFGLQWTVGFMVMCYQYLQCLGHLWSMVSLQDSVILVIGGFHFKTWNYYLHQNKSKVWVWVKSRIEPGPGSNSIIQSYNINIHWVRTEQQEEQTVTTTTTQSELPRVSISTILIGEYGNDM